MRLASRSSAMVPATRSAFLIARAPEAPWQMMHAPRMPSSGPPPNSSYSNRVLSRFRLAATLGPASPGRIGMSRASSSLSVENKNSTAPSPALSKTLPTNPSQMTTRTCPS